MKNKSIIQYPNNDTFKIYKINTKYELRMEINNYRSLRRNILERSV